MQQQGDIKFLIFLKEKDFSLFKDPPLNKEYMIKILKNQQNQE